MANDIQIKRSSVAGKVPDAANVLVGEPVVNLTDKILYTKNGSGDVIIIGAGELQGLSDVSNTSPIANDVLTWNGSSWGPAAASSSLGPNVILGVMVQDAYTANGTGTTYVLTHSTSNANSIIVFVDSVLQSPFTNYTVSGSTLTFTSAPDNNANVDIRYFAQDEFDISIGMLNNVSNTSPLSGQALIWSGTEWAPANVATTANVISVNGQTGVVSLTTTDISEGTNQYFSNARARTAISVTGAGTYDNSTGIITITGGVTSVGGATGAVSNVQLASAVNQTGILTTANVSEVTNLYFSNARVYANVIQLGYITASNLTGYATNSQLTSYATTANSLAQFASTTSAQLAGVISDETGSGALVFATTPTLVTPVLGLATGTSVMLSANIGAAAGNVSGNFTAGNLQTTGNVNAASALFTGAVTTGTLQTTGNVNANNLRVVTNSSLGTVVQGTWNGSSISTTYTDAKVTSVNGQVGAATGFATTANSLAQFASTTSAQLAGVISDETGSGALVFATTPTLVTPVLGLATGTSVMLSANIGAAAGNVSGNFTAGNLQTTGNVNANNLRVVTNSSLGTVVSGTWNGTSISTTYTDAKVTSVNGQTGAVTGFATTANSLSQFASTTSSQLATLISDETGSGALVFATSPVLLTPNIGTPSYAVLTNATGLPVSGITASTSTALGVGSIELGHATDTSLSRSSAGVLAVEGVVVPTVSSTSTLTNKTLTLPVIDNIKLGYTATATAAGTTTLTVSSNRQQLFTGTSTQTVVLPVTSTLVAGMSYDIENNSTGNLTVNSSGGNLVATVIPGTNLHVVCIGTTLTTAADWDAEFTGFGTLTGTGSVVLATSPTLVTPVLGAATGTSLSVSGNVVVSSGNSTGNGLILSDDGDIVDMNDGFASMRFSSGVKIKTTKYSTTDAITLASTGTLTATGNINAASALFTGALTAGTLRATGNVNAAYFVGDGSALTNIANITGIFSKLDDFSSRFNGSNVNFTLSVSSANVSPTTAQNLLISVNGVLQEPQAAYTINGSQITFTEAPTQGSTFFGVRLGNVGSTNAPSDGSVTTPKIVDGAVTSAKIGITPGTSGNVLTSNGTSWTSTAPSMTTGKAIAMAIVFGG